jgi:hypothetical protein
MARYPSFVNLDPFVDVERLRSLDGFIKARIAGHIAAGKDSLFLNEHRLNEQSPYEPGVREIWLSRLVSGTPYDYLDLDNPEVWEPSAASAEFAPLMDFLAILPFAATARVIIIYDYEGNAVPAHRDHTESEVCNEFIWMRTNFDKKFYLLNPDSGEKLTVNSHTAWFDTVNQYHGAEGADGLTFSIRVDGIFTDEFRRQIPFPATNRSSAPALWAEALAGQTGAALAPSHMVR